MQLKKSSSRKSSSRKSSRKSIKGGNFVIQQPQQPILQSQPFSIQKPNVSMLSHQFAFSRCQTQIRAYKINPRVGITPECKKYITI